MKDQSWCVCDGGRLPCACGKRDIIGEVIEEDKSLTTLPRVAEQPKPVELEVVGYCDSDGFLNKHCHGDYSEPVCLVAVAEEIIAQRDARTEEQAREIERLKHSAAEDMLTRLVSQLSESGAVNYQESTFDLDIGSELLEASVTLRHRGAPSAHELRLVAERELAALKAHNPVAWQFLDTDGKWYTGQETNNHRTNTEEAGYQVRELYAGPVVSAQPSGVVLPEDFVCDSRPLQDLLNATALLLETPCQDSATYWAAQLANVEALLKPVSDGGADERTAFELWSNSMEFRAYPLEWLEYQQLYSTQKANIAWQAWQARAALTASAPNHSDRVREPGIREFADEVKQLCKDFSDRADRPYMGDVTAAIDGLYEQFMQSDAMLAAAPSAGSQEKVE